MGHHLGHVVILGWMGLSFTIQEHLGRVPALATRVPSLLGNAGTFDSWLHTLHFGMALPGSMVRSARSMGVLGRGVGGAGRVAAGAGAAGAAAGAVAGAGLAAGGAVRSAAEQGTPAGGTGGAPRSASE